MLLISCSDRSILDRYTIYQAPTYPSHWPGEQEVYDDLIAYGDSLPELVQILALDIESALRYHSSKAIDISGADETVVQQGIYILRSQAWENLPGYRPWTNSHFIKGLTNVEMRSLSKEVHQYLQKNKVWRENEPLDYVFGDEVGHDSTYMAKASDYTISIDEKWFHRKPVNPDFGLDSLMLNDGRFYLHFTRNFKNDLSEIEVNDSLYCKRELTTEWSTELAGILDLNNMGGITNVSISVNHGPRAVFEPGDYNQIEVIYSGDSLFVGTLNHVLYFD